MATKLLLQLEDGRTATARPEAWIQAILAIMNEPTRARVFELAAQFDRDQVQIHEPPGPRYHLADNLIDKVKRN